ncbi:MAG: hypothetical protein JWN38_62 [Candidatus Saccharibacteria bacterium]|nr:hypothetical protein [Candidatus Saccharibacteria bacterium]
MTVSFDTNVVLRLFIKENPKQSLAATSALERYDQIQISDIAIIETIYALAHYYNLGRSAACHYVSSLLSHPKINCNRPLFKEAMSLYEKHPALSIEDCVLSTYAHLNNAAPLLTFDKKLANQVDHTQLLT